MSLQWPEDNFDEPCSKADQKNQKKKANARCW